MITHSDSPLFAPSAQGASLVAYPWDTVRRRLMMQSGRAQTRRHYRNTWDCWVRITRFEGVAAFYKGALANVFRTVGGALVLTTYELLHQLT